MQRPKSIFHRRYVFFFCAQQTALHVIFVVLFGSYSKRHLRAAYTLALQFAVGSLLLCWPGSTKSKLLFSTLSSSAAQTIEVLCSSMRCRAVQHRQSMRVSVLIEQRASSGASRWMFPCGLHHSITSSARSQRVAPYGT